MFVEGLRKITSTKLSSVGLAILGLGGTGVSIVPTQNLDYHENNSYIRTQDQIKTAILKDLKNDPKTLERVTLIQQNYVSISEQMEALLAQKNQSQAHPQTTSASDSKISSKEIVEIVNLPRGSNPWNETSKYLEGVLHRPPTNSEILKADQALCKASKIAVDSWGINGQGFTFHTRLPVGFELNFDSSVQSVIASFQPAGIPVAKETPPAPKTTLPTPPSKRETPTSQPTSSPTPKPAEATSTPTAIPSRTPTLSPTRTPTPTHTPIFTPTHTPTIKPSQPTSTPTLEPTKTVTPIPTVTPTRTSIPTATLTPTPTSTETATPTATKTPTPTPKPLPTIDISNIRIAYSTNRTGNPEVFLSNLVNLTNHPANDRNHVWSPNGRFIYFISNRFGNDDVWRVNAHDPQRAPVNITNHPAQDGEVSSFRDKIAFVSQREGDRRPTIYLADQDGNDVKRLNTPFTDQLSQPRLYWHNQKQQERITYVANTEERRQEIFDQTTVGSDLLNISRSNSEDYKGLPSPDGSKILFISNRGGRVQIFSASTDGSLSPKQLTFEGSNDNPRWSQDGSKIIFQSDRTGRSQIFIMNADGSNQRNFSQNQFNEHSPSFSPDGRMFTFVSNRGGNPDIWVRIIDGSLLDVNVSSDPSLDEKPEWQPISGF